MAHSALPVLTRVVICALHCHGQEYARELKLQIEQKEKEKRDRKQAERQTDAAEFMPPSAPRGVLSLC